MKYFFIIALISFAFSTRAQKIRFSTQNYAGLLEGGDGSSFQLQTINGIKYKTFFAGLGIGLDWYDQRSIPAFLSLSKEFFNKSKKSLYIAANGGVNFPWRENNSEDWYYGTPDKFRAGLYWSSGVGYKIGLGKNSDAMLLHLGYSYKHLSEKMTTVMPCFNPPCPENTERYDFHLRRLSVMLGWSF
jgi:hypothetical protein